MLADLMRRIGISILCATVLIGIANATGSNSRPVKLKFTAPKTNANAGILFTTQWPLTLKMEIPTSVAIISTTEGGLGRRSAWVYNDPDGCLDARSFRISGPIPYESGCTGEDEQWVEATNERDDINFANPDNNGNFVIRGGLKDDGFDAGNQLLNVQYYIDDNGNAKKVPRPNTGGNKEDGIGWGADDDFPGLVITSNTGAAKVLNFDLSKPLGLQHVRNLAGLMQEVSSELLDRNSNSAVTAHTQVLAGMFEPVAVFDLDLDPAGRYGAFDFIRKVDGSAIQGFNSPVVFGNNTETTVALLETISPIDIEVRANVVEGTAPDFIADMDGNGRFDHRDLTLMGYTVLSNEAIVRARLEFESLISFPVGTVNCPHRNLIFLDLDGNGSSGDPMCGGTSSVRRGTRVPR